MKRLVFHVLMWTPLLLLSAAGLHLAFRTNLPQLLYMSSIRNLPFDCIDFVDAPYVYKLKPGACPLANLEYESVIHHDADGFRRSPPAPHYDVAVVGDSHAYGMGVADEETFAYRLASEHGLRVRNLAVGSFATEREIAVLAAYAPDAAYVVLQYCDNDADENRASLDLDAGRFGAMIDEGTRILIVRYMQGKGRGWRKPLLDLGILLREGTYQAKGTWRAKSTDRDVAPEAAAFAGNVARHRDLLEGKRLIVLESSAWRGNSPRFAAAFGAELAALGWLRAKALDSAAVLEDGDAYFLDDHINASGHAKLAAAIAREIAAWEAAEPILARP
jgi:hypothetical protein